MLDLLGLYELDEELSLITEEDKELEDEHVEKVEGEELDILQLLIESSLEHLLLEEIEEQSSPDKQELEELEEWELCDELQLKEQHEGRLLDGLLQEELDDWDSSDELLLEEPID